MADVVFATKRLVARNFRSDDLDAVTAMWGDPIACRFMNEGPMTAVRSKAWLEVAMHHNAVRPREAYNLAIALQETDRAIGWVGFGPSSRSDDGRTFGVGYLLDRAHWRRGYMKEVLACVIEQVFGALGGTTLVAHCNAANLASTRTLESAGFELVGEERDGDREHRLTYALGQG